MSSCPNRKIFSSSRSWLLVIGLLFLLSPLWACHNLSCSTERNLTTLSPQDLSWAFAKAVLVDNDRLAALPFLSAEMEISLDSLLDIAGGSVEKEEDLKISSQAAKNGQTYFFVTTKATKSPLIKEISLLIKVNEGSNKKIASFSAQIKNSRGAVIEL